MTKELFGDAETKAAMLEHRRYLDDQEALEAANSTHKSRYSPSVEASPALNPHSTKSTTQARGKADHQGGGYRPKAKVGAHASTVV